LFPIIKQNKLKLCAYTANVMRTSQEIRGGVSRMWRFSATIEWMREI
jgi:hypothetical protein